MTTRREPAALAALGIATIGFAASCASLIDSLAPEPTFCSASGCATVRASQWAHPLGIPLPIFGVAFFAAMLVLAIVPRPRLRLVGALGGAVFAGALIAIQAFVIGAWCKLCLVSDLAALAHLAAIALAGPATVRLARSWFALPTAIVAVLALHAWDAPPTVPELPPETPECVARAQVPGEVTIVEFVDFECPFCRHMAKELDEAIDRAGPVHMVRKMVPFPSHHGALPAALAWCCADLQGKGEPMAHALFAADPGELTTAGCEKIAASVGLDLDRYRRDLADPATRARVTADLTDAAHAGVTALPTMYIGGAHVVGAGLDADDLADVIRAARE